MKSAIEALELRKRYGDVQALNGVSISVPSGEIFGLLGPNGAGKTTLVESLLGLRQPDSGLIRLLGLDQPEHAGAIRERLGVQLQTTGLLPLLTVLEQINLFRGLYANPLPASEVLGMVELQDVTKSMTKNLSGGQKQRLVVALALINDPDLIFLDEPTTGLDPQARRAIWEVVRRLRQQGKSVLLTTHYMEEAEQLCDRVGIMDQGKIMEMDSPQGLIRKFFDETAIEFAIPQGLDREALHGLPSVKQVLFENGRVTLYSLEVPNTMASLYRLSAQENLNLNDITIRHASLEDVFLKLTGKRIRS